MGRSYVDGLTPEQRTQLDTFAKLVVERGLTAGVIGPGEMDRVWERHIQDSLRVISCLQGASEVADLGSGAGFPGVPLAIVRGDCRVLLVESRRRRAAFLELVVDTLGLTNATVVAGAASGMALRVDLVLGRAVGSAAATWKLAQALLRPGGRVVYFAGRSWSPAQERRLAAMGVWSRICVEPDFPWQGPLVMMAPRGA
jgi:16S rRNA (guanine527-N7)-methyltransferase